MDVLITGHSLGAAVATLMASLLLGEGMKLRLTLVTFGSPRVGDGSFASALQAAEQLRHYRVQNELDVVSRVPYWLPFPAAYEHSQTWHVWLHGGAIVATYGSAPHAAGVPVNVAFFATRSLWRDDNKADVRYHKMGGSQGYVKALATGFAAVEPVELS